MDKLKVVVFRGQLIIAKLITDDLVIANEVYDILCYDLDFTCATRRTYIYKLTSTDDIDFIINSIYSLIYINSTLSTSLNLITTVN